MAVSWTGSSLVTELSTLLGDASTGFQSKVLGWLNDTQRDICARHDWDFLKVKGKKVLTASVEAQTLIISAPIASTATIASGGSLVDTSTYAVKVSFYEGTTHNESVASAVSATVTATAVNKSIKITSIPVSAEPLVTARRIYVSKDGGAFYYYSTISNNAGVIASVTADTTSTIEVQDTNNIRKLYGEIFFETSTNRTLKYMDQDQMRLVFPGAFSSGTPQYWAALSQEEVLLYPKPSTADTLSFYYYRRPTDLYQVVTSIPTIPEWLKPVLKAGVISLGYEYRDRDGQERKLQKYEELLSNFISRTASTTHLSKRVRDVVGNSDGWGL